MKLKKILALCLSVTMLLTSVCVVNAEPSDEMEQNVGVNDGSENESSSENQENQDSVDKDAQKVTEELATEEISSNAQSDVEITDEIEKTQFEKAQKPEDINGKLTGGYIKSDLDQNTPVYYPAARSVNQVPSSYPADLNDYYNEFPDNRNQNPYGTCWAFSSLGLAEYDLIMDGVADKNIDLSELQLAYFTYNFVIDPLGGTEGDTAKYYNENAPYSYLNYGGNYLMASRRLGQWIGAVDESDVPYHLASSTVTNGLDSKYAYNYDKAHLENTYLINIKQNAADVKNQIMEHGAAGVMYYHDDYSMYWNSSNQYYTYYDTAATGGGHAVMVVGWDDNFSKDNFGNDTKPSSDGAWLIRNSWGYYCSYFWMSYETASLSDTAWIFDVSNNDGYDNNYQYDGGVNVYPTGYTTTSNVFTVPEKDGVTSETLKAVSLSCTSAVNVGYKIQIYTDLKDKKNPESGTLQENAITEGATEYAGTYTIPLANTIELKPGSSYAVVVKLDTQALDYEQAITIASGDTVIWDSAVSLGNEKSFYKTGGKYYPFYWGNYCIKAFTSNNVKKIYTISYELDGGKNDTANPTEYSTGNEKITLKAPTKKGYTFEGWFLDSEYKDAITEIPADATQNYVLYAKWKMDNNYDELAYQNKDVIADGEYLLKSAVNTKYVIDVRWGSKDNGANVQVYEKNGSNAQIWQISHDENNYVILKSKNSGKVISVAGDSARNYINVEQKEYKDEKSQRWIAVKQVNGTIVFLSALDISYCIDLDSAKAANGSNVRLYSKNNTSAQRWKVSEHSAEQELADQNQNAISDGEYVIKSAVDSKYVIDVRWGSKDDGANIQAYENNGSNAQIWQINHDANNYVILENKNSGKVLSVKDSSAKNYANIEQQEFTGIKAQKWIAIKQANGQIEFVSALNTSYCVDLNSAKAANESNVQLYSRNSTSAQQWIAENANPVLKMAEQYKNAVIDGEYVIKSAVNSKYTIDVQWASVTDGINIQLYEVNGTSAQTWIISHDSDNFVVLKNKNSGKMLSVKDGSMRNGTNIEQNSYKNNDMAQKWIAVKQLNGNVVFLSALNTNYCIDLDSATAQNERNIQLYTCNGTKAQQWSCYALDLRKKSILDFVFTKRL